MNLDMRRRTRSSRSDAGEDVIGGGKGGSFPWFRSDV